MKNVKRMLLIGVLATASIIGTGCGKSDKSTGSTATGETTAKESKVEETKQKPAKKNEFEYGVTLGTIGGMDLMADREFPKAGYFKTDWLIFGFDENKGELASCFYQRHCINKEDAESNWNVEYSEDLEKIPNSMKGLKTMWDAFLEDGRMYTMYSEQQYEVIVDNTEKVTYNGVDFIKEEGHIDVTRKDPSNTRYPELVRAGYIAYYYFSPEGAGSNPADDNQGYGMGMAIWGVRPVDMSDEAEAKTMEENYEKLKKSTTASMETLISLDDYWKIDKKFY
jgi:lipoprotein